MRKQLLFFTTFLKANFQPELTPEMAAALLTAKTTGRAAPLEAARDRRCSAAT